MTVALTQSGLLNMENKRARLGAALRVSFPITTLHGCCTLTISHLLFLGGCFLGRIVEDVGNRVVSAVAVTQAARSTASAFCPTCVMLTHWIFCCNRPHTETRYLF